MRSSVFAVFLTAILWVSAPAQKQRTDIVIMKNGDRITCEITGLEHGTLFVKLDYVDGTVEIDWTKVAKVESNRLFILKTGEGVVHEGKISSAEPDANKAAKIEVAVDPATKIELATTDVVKIDTSSERFWNRLNGNVNLGLNYSKGNDSTQYNLSSSIEYPRQRWGIEASLNSTLSASDGSRTSTRNELRTRYYRQLNHKKLYFTGGVGFLESTEQGISLETGFTGGLGYYITNSNRAKVAIIGGLVFQRTKYERAGILATTQKSVAAMVSTEIRYFRFKKTGLKLYASLLPSLNEPGRLYFRMNQDYYIKLFSNLTWNISMYGSWDTRPPFGLPGNDYGTSTGLGWTFGSNR